MSKLSTSSEPDLYSFVTEILHDLYTLIRYEVRLAADELQIEVDKIKAAGLWVGLGAGLVLFALLMLVLMFVFVLDEYTFIPLWGCYGIVGAVFGAIGTALLLTARKKMAGFKVVPTRTIETVKENVKWLRELPASTRT